MAKIKKVPTSATEHQYLFMCPGCKDLHAFDDRWEFNQDFEKPTIAPSFLQQGYLGPGKEGKAVYGTCHSFIWNGEIRFLNDCTHDLKGQTVELLEIEI